jgi:hypothetical protein
MNEVTIGLITAFIGIVIGFFGNYFIAKLNARIELKKSVSDRKAAYYVQLWKLCGKNIKTREAQRERYKKLGKWYKKGGGLLLTFKATDKFLGALNILKTSKQQKITGDELDLLISNLSWLRTEMKFEVGSYTRKEANSILPNSKQR